MLVNASKVGTIIFNMQLELIPLLEGGTQLLTDACWLADVSQTLESPLLVVEHKKLGASSKALKEVAGYAPYVEKYYFDFLVHDHIRQAIEAMDRQQFVLMGGETHVCVLQSALALRNLGKDVFVLSDATSARNLPDHYEGLRRLRDCGVHLITKEMFFFECIRQSEFPDYVKIAMKYLDGRYIR